jgi:hypothetical protein
MLRVAIAPPLAHRARRVTALLPWSPVLIGAAYLVFFIARLPGLIERVYWDSDAASAAVIAETAGHGGTVILERFGWFTALWFALLTRPLPLHRQLWEVAPYLFSLASVALLAWASWRLAGRWAAAMTAAAAVATSPFVSYDLVTLNYHTTTWAATVVLAVYCLWLTHQPPGSRLAFASVLVTVLAGTTLASDLLFAFAGLIPFALTGLLLVSLPRFRLTGTIVVASASLALLIAWVTSWGMRIADVSVFAVPTRFADEKDLWPNFGRLLRGIGQLVNGDYFYGAQLNARSALSFACAVLVLIALAAPFVLIRRQMHSATLSVPLLVYSSFWAGSVTFTCASFVLSSEGTHGGYYLIPILYATAATAPLVFAGARVGRLVASLGVAIIATTSLVNLADRRTSLLPGGVPPVASVADRIVEIAKKENVRYGYADYWDASSLTWSTHMAVQVAPVTQCVLPKTDLCEFYFNLNTNWYGPRPKTNTFVLRDSRSEGVRQELPETLGPPYATYTINDVITLYLYPYDVASRFVGVRTGS